MRERIHTWSYRDAFFIMNCFLHNVRLTPSLVFDHRNWYLLPGKRVCVFFTWHRPPHTHTYTHIYTNTYIDSYKHTCICNFVARPLRLIYTLGPGKVPLKLHNNNIPTGFMRRLYVWINLRAASEKQNRTTKKKSRNPLRKETKRFLFSFFRPEQCAAEFLTGICSRLFWRVFVIF
jgi:hypothetical protein